MSVSFQVRWPVRPTLHDIDRGCIVGACLSVLSAMTGGEPGEQTLVERGEDRGEYYGYYAARETWEAPVGGVVLRWVLDPIMATMGVSGEAISIRAVGLSEGITMSGRALSSARRPGHAALTLSGVDAAPLEAMLRSAFGPYGDPTPDMRAEVALQRVRIDLAWSLLSPSALQVELVELRTLAAAGNALAQEAIVSARVGLEGASHPRRHYADAIAFLGESK